VSRSGGGGHRVVGEQGADEAVAEVGEGEALHVGVALLVAGRGDHEVDERVVGVAAVDRERGDARAGDHGEGEEGLADDVAQGLEAPDSIADALEPAVGTDGIEREDAFLGHDRVRRRVARARGAVTRADEGLAWCAASSPVFARCRSRPSGGTRACTPQPSQRAASRREGQCWSMPRWQREKSYFTGSSGSSARREAVISSAVVQDTSLRG
jgi:hypothetical protein